MSYKDGLGIAKGDKGSIFSPSIDEHFVKLGFYEATMNPRFMNEESSYDELTLGVPVLRYDGDWWGNQGVQRVFMNQNEVYVERQTGYRSFDGCGHYKFDHPPTSILEIEEILDDLVRTWEF